MTRLRSILRICLCINFVSTASAAPYDTLLSFLQRQEPQGDSQPAQLFSNDAKSKPTWVDEQDLLAEYQSSQAERANDLSLRALEKRRAAQSLRKYVEGIDLELKRLKHKRGKENAQLRLTAQLEANLARVSLLLKEADLLQAKANEAKEKLENLHLDNSKESVLMRDCDILKIGPLLVSPQTDSVNHRNKQLLMAKLSGNSLVLYDNKVPLVTFYMVDVTLPTLPVENASSCFSFGYRGAQQVLCAATEISCHTWMNALSEAWFCTNKGIKGTLVNLKKIRPGVSILEHAVKPNKDRGLVNMEIYAGDDKKTHLLINGKERPISSVKNILDLEKIIKENNDAAATNAEEGKQVHGKELHGRLLPGQQVHGQQEQESKKKLLESFDGEKEEGALDDSELLQDEDQEPQEDEDYDDHDHNQDHDNENEE